MGGQRGGRGVDWGRWGARRGDGGRWGAMGGVGGRGGARGGGGVRWGAMGGNGGSCGAMRGDGGRWGGDERRWGAMGGDGGRGALALALALLLRWVGAGEPSRPLTRFVTPASPCYSFTYACLVLVFSCSFVFFSTSAFCLFFVCLFLCLFFLPYRVLASCLFGGCFCWCFCLFLLLLVDSPCHWFVSSAPKSAKMLKMLRMQGQHTRSLHSQAKPSKAKPVIST